MFTMFNALPRRFVNVTGFLFCAGVLGYAIYLQFQQDLEPCPLCIFQRIAFIFIGVCFLLAALHNAGRVFSRIYAVLIATGGLIGAAIASRHVWIQNLPPEQVPECGPPLDYMLEVFPLGKALTMAFTGSGECAEVSWTFLGLSMPAWALLCFIGLTIVGLVRNWTPE